MTCLIILMAEIWLLLLLSGDRRRFREALAIEWPESSASEMGDRRSKPRTRLLVVTSNFAPEMTGIGKYVGEMTAWMFRAGYEIRVVTAPPYYPAWRVATGYSSRRYARERHSGALVYRCPLLVPRRPGGISRLLHTISFSLSTLPVILWQAFSWRPQLVFVVEPPLTCAPAAILAAKICGAQAWLHVQDFEVDAAFDLGLLRNERLRRCAFGAEKWLMRRFDRVSSISGAMLKKLGDKGVDPGRIGFFPNWVDTRLIRPLAGENRLRAELGIDTSTTVLLYSGNMGEKQGLNLIVEVARTFAGSANILFLLCGDGAAKWRTMQAAAGLTNVRFIALQPLERLNELLNLADVHLLPQRAEAEDLVMPSKLTAIMASGRPVVASARAGSDVARAAGAGGLVVPPGDAEAFGAAIRRLLSDVRLRADLARAGRVYAASNWDRETVLQAMMAQLEVSLAKPAHAQPAVAGAVMPEVARSATRE
jgi:colanic acid biosynthesis glycosyl transferase WcaI